MLPKINVDANVLEPTLGFPCLLGSSSSNYVKAVESSDVTPSLKSYSMASKNNSSQGWECRSGASFYMHEALGPPPTHYHGAWW